MREIRSTEISTGESLQLLGTPIVFEEETVILDKMGNYKEIIKRGALDEADLSDIQLLYNHNPKKLPLARSPKTMSFYIDDNGLHMKAILPDTEEARALHLSVSRGDLSGMSFSFSVPPGGSSYNPKTNTRTITKIAKVYECSITPFPAYPSTSVEARTQIIEEQGRDIQKNRLKIKVNQIIKKGW